MTTPNRTFVVNDEEEKVIQKWHKAIQKRLIKEGKAPKSSWGCGPNEIYYGTISGGLRYIFIPTSIGTILTVEEAISGEQLNVTDALGWKDF